MAKLKKEKSKETLLVRALNRVETVGNKMPDPATIFLVLMLITMVVSAICSSLGVSVDYQFANSQTGEIESKTVEVVNLFSAESLRHFFTSIISNFTGFIALGTVFTVILGVGVADGTGLMSALMRRIAANTPKAFLTPIIILLGIMSHMASSTGYVVLVPLGAILFMAFKRHPIAGLSAAFAGVSGGWAANLLIGSGDPMFAGISTQAAQTLDANYTVMPVGNWYFMIASSILIVVLGTIITNKIVEPRLTPFNFEEHEEVENISGNESRGLLFAGISAIVYIAIMLFMILPENSILRDPETGGLLQSPFMKSIIPIMMMLFLVPGIFFGIGAKTIQNDKDVIKLMNKAIAGLSSFMVMIFFAAQFTALFNYSNIGTVISVSGANFLESIGLVGLPLLICFIIITAAIDILISVDSAKWAIMAPIFVPMFMRLGLSPELTQMAYRIGDSCTNIIAPTMPFFVLTVAFFQKYDKKAGIGTVVSTMLPYSVLFLIGWIILISGWYLLGLPLGPGAGLHYPA